jgi:D-lactate dehydrogenase
MRVVVFETEDWEAEGCRRLMPVHDVMCSREPLNRHTAKSCADAEAVTTFVNSKLDVLVLEQLPRLQLIATRSTGFDHIDLDYCRSRGITVCNVPGYGDHTVAEHVFALLLAIARNLVDAAERTRRGHFHQSGLRGFELYGKTLGVIGTGRIGRAVIAIARGFAMQVVAFDVRPDEEAARALGLRYAALDEVLRAADVVTLHVPATLESRHMLSDREFALMKDGAVLINTARGHVVDVAALIRALSTGKLRAAGIDVLPEEPLIQEEAEIFRSDAPEEDHDLRALVANHVLLRFSNVIVTPHNAYNTDSALRRIIDTTLDNIEAFARGTPMNVVAGPGHPTVSP